MIWVWWMTWIIWTILCRPLIGQAPASRASHWSAAHPPPPPLSVSRAAGKRWIIWIKPFSQLHKITIITINQHHSIQQILGNRPFLGYPSKLTEFLFLSTGRGIKFDFHSHQVYFLILLSITLEPVSRVSPHLKGSRKPLLTFIWAEGAEEKWRNYRLNVI